MVAPTHGPLEVDLGGMMHFAVYVNQVGQPVLVGEVLSASDAHDLAISNAARMGSAFVLAEAGSAAYIFDTHEKTVGVTGNHPALLDACAESRVDHDDDDDPDEH